MRLVKSIGLGMHDVRGEHAWVQHECTTCYNWIQLPHSITNTPSPDFPKSELVNGKIPTEQLTYSHLKWAANNTHQKISSGEWSSAQAREYLKVHCINTESQDGILKCATNCKAQQDAIANNNQVVINACQRESELHPEEWSIWSKPPIWSTDLAIRQLTEPAMHQLFLGITKNQTLAIQDWAAMRNKYSTLRRQLEERTTMVEQLHLSWCKVQPYTGEKLGGWYSKTSLGLPESSHGRTLACLHWRMIHPLNHQRENQWEYGPYKSIGIS